MTDFVPWQTLDDLPVTTPARTIGDLAAAEVLDSAELELVIRGFVAGGWATTNDLSATIKQWLPSRWQDLVSTLNPGPEADGS